MDAAGAAGRVCMLCYAMLCYAMLQISYRYVAHVPTAEQGLVPACAQYPAQRGSIQQRFVRLAAVQGHIIVAKTRRGLGILYRPEISLRVTGFEG